MSISVRTLLLLAFSVCSFGAYSKEVIYYKVTKVWVPVGCLSVGENIVDRDQVAQCYLGKPVPNWPNHTYSRIAGVGYDSLYMGWSNKEHAVALWKRYELTCSEDAIWDPSTGQCVEPPTCSEDEIYNPDTGECESPPPPKFCSSPEYQSLLQTAERQCLDEGGTFESMCNDSINPPEYSFNCDIPPPPPEGCEPGSPSWPQCLDDENKCDENHPDWNPEYGMCCNAENDYCDVPPPESCTIFSPDWPECAGDTDINPPTGGDLGKPDKPDGGGSGNPEPDKPEPDVDDKPDANQAIKAMNEDMNKQLTSINNDLNKNHAESKSALDALKASIDLNTDTSVDAANHLQDTLERQGQADLAIGNKTNQLLTSANNLLNGGFASLSNGLDDLQGSNETGFGNVVGAVEGLGEKIDGIGDISDPLGAGPVLLYDGEDLLALRADVDNLKDEYKSILNDFKNYFNFNSGVNSGDFNSHNLGLNWQGHEINKENQVLKTLRDNAGIISAVVIFMFGVAGIRVLVGAL
ncbi:hypothetical protein [Vibrio owensii]|uniref:hypothetical protein n=1 Tax=Vibrio owensii TaxID=696485 RepID=UPI0006983080|nr:hypothetical protein [Vibrio owensii]